MHELESLVESTSNRKVRRAVGTSDSNDICGEEAESPAIMLLNEAVAALSVLKSGGKETLATLKDAPTKSGEMKIKSSAPKDSCDSPPPPPPLHNNVCVDTSIPSTGTLDTLVHQTPNLRSPPLVNKKHTRYPSDFGPLPNCEVKSSVQNIEGN